MNRGAGVDQHRVVAVAEGTVDALDHRAFVIGLDARHLGAEFAAQHARVADSGA